MKITKQRLKEIIKEELSAGIEEADTADSLRSQRVAIDPISSAEQEQAYAPAPGTEGPANMNWGKFLRVLDRIRTELGYMVGPELKALRTARETESDLQNRNRAAHAVSEIKTLLESIKL